MNKIKYIVIYVMFLVSCTKDTDKALSTLATYIQGRVIEQGAVIACAASDKDTGNILAFYYAKQGATNVGFYQTLNSAVNQNDFGNYTKIEIDDEPVFNGYLKRFVQNSATEKFIIITFELDNEIKLSNPIRTKQISKPTVWNDNVMINQNNSGMPSFSWDDNPEGENAIYFQVISTVNNDLLSGTYTYENHFQYYDTSNVVLNITTTTPTNLNVNENYNFTLMDVSLDNWVNWVAQKPFIAK
ncbi:hypothetical protein [Algibacter pectinivorans]|uniref:Uncharacterized protein n=1 Tax=Algibacter pectinivorans TaxID=870482 RepID=A0A1I1MFN8_9FLAO|nr:hypothetical protein [Algibacter pectinivorans]SFC83995.1 hypothetical protein SAMN04487987_101220 [Algibacter pectinivorans]